MDRSGHVKDYICFVELKGLLFEDDYNQSPEDFVTKKEHLLPIIMRVTGGYCGQNSSTTFSSDEVYFVSHILKQKRVIVKDHFGQMLSFPADHSLKFYTLIEGVKSEKTMKLEEIVMLDEVIISRKTDLIPDPKKGEKIEFCVGPDATVSLQLGLMTFMASYDERYIVGNSIVYEKLHDRPFIIPMWMPITVDAGIGLKGMTHPEYEAFITKMSAQSKCFNNGKAPGNKDIMLFMDDIGEYEGVYDIIVPRNKDYGKLPIRQDDLSIQPPPPVAQREPIQQKDRRKPPKPKKENSGGIFNKLFPGKLSRSTSVPSTTIPQERSNNIQPNTPVNPGSYEYIEPNNREQIPDNSTDQTYVMSYGIQNTFPRSNSIPTETSFRQHHTSGGNTSPRSKMSSVLQSTVNHHLKHTVNSRETKQQRHDTYEQCEPHSNVKEDYNNNNDHRIKPNPVKPKPVQKPIPANKPVTAEKPLTVTKSVSVITSKMEQKPFEANEYGKIWEEDRLAYADEQAEYVSYRELPRTCKGMTVKQVTDCLKLLKFDKHIQTFEDNDIDGDLLHDLDELTLEEFGFSKFEVKKMIKFVKGWRPNVNQ